MKKIQFKFKETTKGWETHFEAITYIWEKEKYPVADKNLSKCWSFSN